MCAGGDVVICWDRAVPEEGSEGWTGAAQETLLSLNPGHSCLNLISNPDSINHMQGTPIMSYVETQADTVLMWCRSCRWQQPLWGT